MRRVDDLSGQELEDDQLGREQNEEADDQRPWAQEPEVREDGPELVRHVGRDRQFGRPAAGTTMSAMMRTEKRMNMTMTQFTISIVREIFLPKRVMANTRNRSPAPSALTVVSSSTVRARPKIIGKRLSPAACAHPPQMNAK